MPNTIAIHPAANLFPMMSEAQYIELRDSIKKHGVQEDMVIFEGQLLDGRNRLRACEELGIDWNRHCVETDMCFGLDPIQFVLNANLHRRHLTPSQCGMVAGRARELYEAQAKERQQATLKQNQNESTVKENLPERRNGQARDQAGKAVGVSGKTVDAATKVLESKDDELIAMVDRGEVSVSAAATVATLPEAERKQVANAGPASVKQAASKARVEKVKAKAKLFTDRDVDAAATYGAEFVCQLLGLMSNDHLENIHGFLDELMTERGI